ncbi:ATP synthase F1 subcomplex delta subunit [Mariprofundus ferrinatatus]|uniref:ATP synthase subunit delta n=1 Tax=Mariprofundus ferrinatatus TaxID=1921087 RepID=A0A2K8L6B9_9PROT|nr:ATP synthase F1 subunit delta [Mariprofundus ferrinatatus]ATX82652.1 ATP synthase F1 subcomplex delta subunit [Mariprofundus ferrinatatus]
MSTSQISRRYARALFDLIQEGADLRGDLEKVAAVVATDEVADFLASPEYPAELKKQVIVKSAGGVSSEVDRLVALLADRGKASLLSEIHSFVEEMLHQAESELEADVVVATAMDPALQEKLSAALTASTGKKVRLNVSEDNSILGGMVIRIGDRKIDYSLRAKLNGLRRTLAA